MARAVFRGLGTKRVSWVKVGARCRRSAGRTAQPRRARRRTPLLVTEAATPPRGLPRGARPLLLLQNAAFLTLFRGAPDRLKQLHLDELRPAELEKDAAPTLDEIFADVSRDRMVAARKTLAWLKQQPDPREFINAARRLV